MMTIFSLICHLWCPGEIHSRISQSASQCAALHQGGPLWPGDSMTTASYPAAAAPPLSLLLTPPPTPQILQMVNTKTSSFHTEQGPLGKIKYTFRTLYCLYLKAILEDVKSSYINLL